MDNWFQTVEAKADTTINFDDDMWYRTFGLTEWQYIPEDRDETPTENTPLSTSEGANQRERLRAVRDQLEPPQPIPLEPIPDFPTLHTPPRRNPPRNARPPQSIQREQTPQGDSPLQRENNPPPLLLPPPVIPPDKPSPIYSPQDEAQLIEPLQREKERNLSHNDKVVSSRA